jgi:hypothetical protein
MTVCNYAFLPLTPLYFTSLLRYIYLFIFVNLLYNLFYTSILSRILFSEFFTPVSFICKSVFFFQLYYSPIFIYLFTFVWNLYVSIFPLLISVIRKLKISLEEIREPNTSV